MTRIFYLASDLSSNAGAKLLSFLSPALPSDRFVVATTNLRVSAKNHVRGYWTLKKAIEDFRPDVLHAIGPVAALWTSLLLAPRIGLRRRPKLVVSQNDQPAFGVLGWLNRRANHSADAIVSQTETQANRYLNQGISPDRIHTILPAVAPLDGLPDGDAFRQSLGIPQSAPLVMAVGRFDTIADLKTAVWAFDVVKHVVPELHLLLIGDGPERERLERLGRAIGFDDYRVRFAGFRSDVAGLLNLAEVVWITHQHGGINVALEAMAAGKPIVALQTPELAEIIEDTVTGQFVAPGNKVRLAAVTNELLANPELAKQMGEVGRKRAATHFALAPLVARFSVIYDKLMTDGPR